MKNLYFLNIKGFYDLFLKSKNVSFMVGMRAFSLIKNYFTYNDLSVASQLGNAFAK